MVSVLDSGSSGPGSGPGRGRCVVFLLAKTLYSHGASLHCLTLIFKLMGRVELLFMVINACL